MITPLSIIVTKTATRKVVETQKENNNVLGKKCSYILSTTVFFIPTLDNNNLYRIQITRIIFFFVHGYSVHL